VHFVPSLGLFPGLEDKPLRRGARSVATDLKDLLDGPGRQDDRCYASPRKTPARGFARMNVSMPSPFCKRLAANVIESGDPAIETDRQCRTL
jgi:hypothetical protein